MVLQKLWVLQNFSQISQVSQSRFLAVKTVHLAVLIFIQSCLRVLTFRKVEGLEILICLSVFINDVYSSFDILNFNEATFKFLGKS